MNFPYKYFHNSKNKIKPFAFFECLTNYTIVSQKHHFGLSLRFYFRKLQIIVILFHFEKYSIDRFLVCFYHFYLCLPPAEHAVVQWCVWSDAIFSTNVSLSLSLCYTYTAPHL